MLPAPMRMPLHVSSVHRITGLRPDAIDNENGHCSGHSQTKATCRAVSRELACVWVGSYNPPWVARERIAESHCKCGDGLLRHHLRPGQKQPVFTSHDRLQLFCRTLCFFAPGAVLSGSFGQRTAQDAVSGSDVMLASAARRLVQRTCSCPP